MNSSIEVIAMMATTRIRETLTAQNLDGDQFKNAIKSINKGLSRGGVKRPDTARLVLGMAYFNDKQYDSARKAFKAAGRDERSEKYAQQWLKYLDSELNRQKKLAES